MGKKDRLRKERREAALEKVKAATSGWAGFELKVQRAREHLETLDDAIKWWLEAHSDLVREEIDPETGEHVITVEPALVAPADDIALIAADCVHNLRAALDQLVYSLSWAYTAGPLPKSVAQGCEFPVYGPRAPTSRDLKKRIGAIHPDAQTIIKGLQPHERGDAFPSEKLWVLDQLWNLDKHRTLPLVVFAHQATVFGKQPGEIIEIPGEMTLSVVGPVRSKAEAMRFSGVGPHHNVDMKSTIELDIAFGQGTPAKGEPVIELLTGLIAYVSDDVVVPLARFL